MFQVGLDLGELPQRLYPLGKNSQLIREALTSHGYDNPHKYLLRGGFGKRRDFDLLLSYGSDYHGRRWKLGLGNRTDPDGIYLADISHIGHAIQPYDPLWNALKPENEVHAIAVFDRRHFKLILATTEEYRFKQPTKKLEALLGILHLRFSLS